MDSRRTWGVLGATVLLLVAALVSGLFVLRTFEGLRAGATWNDYRVTRNGLVVFTDIRACAAVDGFEVDERRNQVVVTISVDRGPLWCSDPEEEERTRIRLERPLGDRRVFDGRCLDDGEPRRECRREER